MLFSTLILGSVFRDYVVFYGDLCCASTASAVIAKTAVKTGYILLFTSIHFDI